MPAGTFSRGTRKFAYKLMFKPFKTIFAYQPRAFRTEEYILKFFEFS
jgi:hypothetical protein